MVKSKKKLKKKNTKVELIDSLLLALLNTVIVSILFYVFLSDISFVNALTKIYESGKVISSIILFFPVILVFFLVINIGYKALMGKM